MLTSKRYRVFIAVAGVYQLQDVVVGWSELGQEWQRQLCESVSGTVSGLPRSQPPLGRTC